MKHALLTAVFGLLLAGTACAQASIPDLHIEMAYQQLEDGKRSPGVHILDLWCDDGRCDLLVTSLNQCLWGSFYPKVERSSNRVLAGHGSGSLQVTYAGNGLLRLEEDIDSGGKITWVFRFREARTEDEENFSRNSLFRNDGELPKRLVITDFQGGFTKYSAILDKVISVAYVPIVEPTPIKLDCTVDVPWTHSLRKPQQPRSNRNDRPRH
jgi:hypothetical protein